jgi:hypothetical protein
MNSPDIIEWMPGLSFWYFTLGTRFAFPFDQRPLVLGFAEGFYVPFDKPEVVPKC